MNVGTDAVRRSFSHVVTGLARDGALTWLGRNLAKLLSLKIKLSPLAEECLTGANKMDPMLRKVLSRLDLQGALSASEAVQAINERLDGIEIHPAAQFIPNQFFLTKIAPPTAEHEFLLDCTPLPVFRLAL